MRLRFRRAGIGWGAQARRAVPLLLGVAVVAACGSPAAALPLRVTLDWPSGRPASAPGQARIRALRTAGPTEGGLPVEAEAGPDGAVLDLGDGVWQVQAEALGYWSQAAQVAVDRQAPAGVRLALWPAATLRGDIQTAARGPLPRTLDVRLSAVPAPARGTSGLRAAVAPPAPILLRAELRCPIDEGVWSCPGPAGLFDAELSVAGYAPRYLWDLDLETGAIADLGRTVLHRGASVLGRATREDGSNPPGPCRATLRPDVQADPTRRGAGEPGPESAPDASASAPLGRRGHFHVTGLPPGAYVLAIECEAASAVRELRVPPDSETRVDPPLLLEELTLDVVVTPKVDPEGRPWQLTVESTAPCFRRVADQAMVSADGRWTRRGLTAGSYRVALKGADGTQRLLRFLELGPGSGPLALHLGYVAVAGRALLGTQPLRGRLVFFNEAGGEPVTLASDDDGRFQGLLPVAAHAQETHWTVEAHATQPPINRRVQGVSVQAPGDEAPAWLELAVPMFAVSGTVVSESGEPQSGVQVTFENASSGARTVTATDDAGSFELRELPPGSYTAVADSIEGVSERTGFEVVEGVESELPLVLNRSERVAFYVVGGQGPVADAAVQVWIPPGVPRSFARTDSDGRFEADLPPGTKEVGLTVGAPGQALKLIRLSVSSDPTITLGATGGTLVLDFGRPGQAVDNSATPYLVHNGAIEAAGALAGWGTASAGASGRGPTVVDAIEPGVYALCLAGPEELAALWRGALPSDRCRSGSLDSGGTLTLSTP